jgi:hypothetical protein
VKEEALKKLEVVVQETKKSPSIVIVESSTMTNKNMVNSPSNTLADFEKNTRVISSNIMRKMGCDGQGLGKEGKGIFIPIVAQQSPNNEGLGFSRQETNTSAGETTFLKVRGTRKEFMWNKPLKFPCRSLEEGRKEMIMPKIFSPTQNKQESSQTKEVWNIFFLLQEKGS